MVQHFGVNEAGAEFGTVPGTLNHDYLYPASSLGFFASQGLTLCRIPFRWERIQPTPLGPLSQPDIDGLKSILSIALQNGNQVILDLHNFGQLSGAPLTVADAPKLADVWGRIAQALSFSSAIFGYELMNEPHDLVGGVVTWSALAQAAITAIRRYDRSHRILMPGYQWQSAANWPTANLGLLATDPSDNLIYAAHQYFDDGSGTYVQPFTGSPTDGASKVQPFLSWLADNDVFGIVTEYGVPNSDTGWLPVLDNFLSALSQNRRILGGTYWAAGPWWGAYPLSVEPGSSPATLSILLEHPTQQ